MTMSGPLGASNTNDALRRDRFDRVINYYRNEAARYAGTDPAAASSCLELAARLAVIKHRLVPDVDASSRPTKQHCGTDLDNIRARLAALEARLPSESSRTSDSPGTTRSE